MKGKSKMAPYKYPSTKNTSSGDAPNSQEVEDKLT